MIIIIILIMKMMIIITVCIDAKIRRREKRDIKSSKNDVIKVVIEVVVEFNGKEIFFILELYFFYML